MEKVVLELNLETYKEYDPLEIGAPEVVGE